MLVTAIRPDDPTDQLVYADWLDEHDNPIRAAWHRAMGRLLMAHEPLRQAFRQVRTVKQFISIHRHDSERLARYRATLSIHGALTDLRCLLTDLPLEERNTLLQWKKWPLDGISLDVPALLAQFDTTGTLLSLTDQVPTMRVIHSVRNRGCVALSDGRSTYIVACHYFAFLARRFPCAMWYGPHGTGTVSLRDADQAILALVMPVNS